MLVTMPATVLMFMFMVSVDVMFVVIYDYDFFSHHGSFVLCCHGGAYCCADRAADDGAVTTAHALTDRGTQSAADGAAYGGIRYASRRRGHASRSNNGKTGNWATLHIGPCGK